MIALNESQEYAAEIPFTLPLESDPLTGLTGWSFTLGEVQVRFPGSLVWTDVAVSRIVEKGYGRFCARLTALQTTTAGIVAIRAAVSGTQPYFGSETIGTLGGDIPVGGEGYIVFFLPDSTDPVYGAPVDAADFTTTGLVRVCEPNSTYRDATTDELAGIINLGHGGYAFPVSSAISATRGKIFLYVEYPDAQSFESYSTILGVGASAGAGSGAGSGSGTTPIISVTPPASEDLYVDHVRAALNRLCFQFRSGDEITQDELDALLTVEL